MTDLEAHVAQSGRDDLVKQVSEKIKETGVTYIYYQFVSVTGRIVGREYRPPIGSASLKKVSSWSTVQQRIFSSTGTETTSATAQKLWSWEAFLTQKLFVNCPGTNGSAVCFVHCFAIVRNVRIRVVY